MPNLFWTRLNETRLFGPSANGVRFSASFYGLISALPLLHYPYFQNNVLTGAASTRSAALRPTVAQLGNGRHSPIRGVEFQDDRQQGIGGIFSPDTAIPLDNVSDRIQRELASNLSYRRTFVMRRSAQVWRSAQYDIVIRTTSMP